MNKYFLCMFLLFFGNVFCSELTSRRIQRAEMDTTRPVSKLLVLMDEASTNKELIPQVITMIQGADIAYLNSHDRKGITPVMMAIFWDLTEVLELLLSKPGIDITAKDLNGNSAFRYSLWHPESLKILLKHKDTLTPKLDLNEICQDRTSLYCAIEAPLPESAEILLAQKETDINIPCIFNRWHVLHYLMTRAGGTQETRIIRSLIDCGANIECLDDTGQTPLQFRLWNRYEYEHRANPSKAIALLALGAKKLSCKIGPLPLPIVKNNNEVVEQALLTACYEIAVLESNLQSNPRIKELLEKSAHANAKDSIFGMTALMWAAARGQLDLAKLLLTHSKIDVAACDNYGWTALHYAALNGHEHIVQLLLERSKAVAEIKSTNGKLPVDLAKMRDHKAVVHMLIKDQNSPIIDQKKETV